MSGMDHLEPTMCTPGSFGIGGSVPFTRSFLINNY